MAGKRKWGDWLVMGVGVAMAVRGVVDVVKLHRAGGRVKQAQEELVKLEEERKELEKKLAEVERPEFVEREAREKFGLGKEGEVIVVLTEQNKIQDSRFKIQEESNWRKWRKLYLGF